MADYHGIQGAKSVTAIVKAALVEGVADSDVGKKKRSRGKRGGGGKIEEKKTEGSKIAQESRPAKEQGLKGSQIIPKPEAIQPEIDRGPSKASATAKASGTAITTAGVIASTSVEAGISKGSRNRRRGSDKDDKDVEPKKGSLLHSESQKSTPAAATETIIKKSNPRNPEPVPIKTSASVDRLAGGKNAAIGGGGGGGGDSLSGGKKVAAGTDARKAVGNDTEMSAAAAAAAVGGRNDNRLTGKKATAGGGGSYDQKKAAAVGGRSDNRLTGKKATAGGGGSYDQKKAAAVGGRSDNRLTGNKAAAVPGGGGSDDQMKDIGGRNDNRLPEKKAGGGGILRLPVPLSSLINSNNTATDIVADLADRSGRSSKPSYATATAATASTVDVKKGRAGSAGQPSSSNGNKQKLLISMEKTMVLASAPIKREPREGVDFPRQRKKHDPLTLTMTVEELAAQRIETQKREVERKWQRARACETSFQKALDELRGRNRSLLQDYCLLGPAMGAPELYRQLKDLESSYLDLLQVDLSQATEEKVPQKIWSARQKILEVFQAVLSNRSFLFASYDNSNGGNGNKGSGTTAAVSGKGLSAAALFMSAASGNNDFDESGVSRDADKPDKQQLYQIGSVYFQELNSAIQFINEVLSVVSMGTIPQLDPSDTSSKTHRNRLRAKADSAQCMYVALGDLNRYKEALEWKSKEKSSTSGKSSSALEESQGGQGQSLSERRATSFSYYYTALQLAPWNGLPYKSLASIAKRKGDHFQTAYLLLRSMCVEQPYDGREPLLSIFEKGHEAAEALSATTALSALSTDEHRARFRAHILASAGIAYSRAGADKLTGHVEKARRHLASLLQMLANEAANHSSSNSIGSATRDGGQFYDFDKKKRTITNTMITGSSEAPGESSACSSAGGTGFAGGIRYAGSRTATLIADIDEDAYRAAVMCLTLLHTIAAKNDLKGTVRSSSWNEAVATDPTNAHQVVVSTTSSAGNTVVVVTEEEAIYAKRYLSKRLHAIQCMPGLVDVVRLTLGLLTTLLLSGCEPSSGSGGQSGVTATGAARVAATVRAVGVFLAWLEANEEYHVTVLIDKLSWDQFDTALLGYFDALRPRSLLAYFQSVCDTTEGDDAYISVDTLQHEDYDLAGFKPLKDVITDRLSSSLTDAVDNNDDNDDDGDDRLSKQLHQLSITAGTTAISSSVTGLQSGLQPGGAAERISSLRDTRLSYQSILARALRVRGAVLRLSARDIFLGGVGDGDGYGESKTKVAIAFDVHRNPIPALAAVISTSDHQHREGDLGSGGSSSGAKSVAGQEPDSRLKVLSIGRQLSALQTVGSLGEKGSTTGSKRQPQQQQSGKGKGAIIISAEDFMQATGGSKEEPQQKLAIIKEVATAEATIRDDDEVEGETVVFPGRPSSSVSVGDIIIQARAITGPSTTTNTATATATAAASETIPASVVTVDQDDCSPATDVDHSPADTTAERKGGLLMLPSGALLSRNKNQKADIATGSGGSGDRSGKSDKGTGGGGRGGDGRGILSGGGSGGGNNNNKNNSSSKNSSNSKGKKGGDTPLPLIVIDAPNVAMRHGMKARFSCRGVKLAVDFFLSQGHKVVSFLPDYYLDYERVGELRRVAKLGLSNVREAQIPDDISLLRTMVDQGYITGTPPQDYDDSYCITYARRHAGFVITNDMYRDHIGRVENLKARDELRSWIKSHCISYTFVGDEFLPNPDFSFEATTQG